MKSVYVVVPVSKHLAGQHDQSSHGNWADSNAQKLKTMIRQSHKWYFENFRKHRDATMGIQMPEEAVLAFLNEGKFKNYHESGETRGSLGIDRRKQSELRTWGIPLDAPASMRPIFASAIEPNGIFLMGATEHFGEVLVVLKDEVKKRSTFTNSDSLLYQQTPVSATGKITNEQILGDKESLPNDIIYTTSDDYPEFQIFGGLTPKDVQEIIINGQVSKINKEKILQAGAKAGIVVHFPSTHPATREQKATKIKLARERGKFELFGNPIPEYEQELAWVKQYSNIDTEALLNNVAKSSVIVKVPVKSFLVKHLQGKHDQSSHGNWADGDGSNEISIQQLASIINANKPYDSLDVWRKTLQDVLKATGKTGKPTFGDTSQGMEFWRTFQQGSAFDLETSDNIRLSAEDKIKQFMASELPYISMGRNGIGLYGAHTKKEAEIWGYKSDEKQIVKMAFKPNAKILTIPSSEANLVLANSGLLESQINLLRHTALTDFPTSWFFTDRLTTRNLMALAMGYDAINDSPMLYDPADTSLPDREMVVLNAGALVVKNPNSVEKHLAGQHDQSTHGNWADGKEIQLNSPDNESAWNAILTEESKSLQSPRNAHPERYDSRGNLIEGQTALRMASTRDGQSAPEVLEVMAVTPQEWIKVPDSERVSSPIYGKIIARKPLKHLYRVVSEAEFNQAKERGFFQSDARMNLDNNEGTVASHRSTGAFYAPTNGDNYRIVRFRYDPVDNWRLDFDGYEKTNLPIPFDRVDAFTSVLTNPSSLSKHYLGQHDQSTHGNWSHGAVHDFADTTTFLNAVKKFSIDLADKISTDSYQLSAGSLSEDILVQFFHTDDFANSKICKELQEQVKKVYPNAVFLKTGGGDDNTFKGERNALVITQDNSAVIMYEAMLRRLSDEVVKLATYRKLDNSELLYQSFIADDLKNMQTDGKICMAIDEESFTELLQSDDQRFKTQFETQKSNGLFSKASRLASELRCQSIPINEPVSKRPLYGYVSEDDLDENVLINGPWQYGDIRIVFKDNVKPRSTVTVGDSLGTGCIPVSMTQKEITPYDAWRASDRILYNIAKDEGWNNESYEIGFLNEGSYFEAQIHDGAKLSDVEAVYIPSDSFADISPLVPKGIRVVEY